MDEIAFAKGAPGQHLHRIGAAGIGFDDGHQFLVFGALLLLQKVHGGLGGFVTNRQAGADVAVEVGAALEVFAGANLLGIHEWVLLGLKRRNDGSGKNRG